VAWVKLRFEVQGEVQVARAFEASGDQAEDMRDPLERVGGSIIETVGQQFATEGGYSGLPWKPLDPAYAAWKESQVGPNPILVFTGAMRSTLLNRRAALTITPKRLVYKPVGEHDDLASYHQGGSADRGLPQRRMVQIPAVVSRTWERYFHEWLRTDVLWRFS
jgi:hypothetical protein